MQVFKVTKTHVRRREGSGTLVTLTKGTGATNIGVELEIGNISKISEWKDRFNKYVDYFAKYRGKKHISFYMDDRNTAMALYSGKTVAEYFLDLVLAK